MGISYNFQCDKCGNTTYLEAENEYQKVLICEKCAECYVVERKKEKQQNIPHCPKCGSTNIQMVQRKWSPLTGFMTNKVDRVCVNCKHKF